MKGIDIVVKGSVGHMSAFMAQAGNLVVLRRRRRRAGQFHLRGAALRARHRSQASARTASRSRWVARIAQLSSGCWTRPASPTCRAGRLQRYGSARRLYHFHVDNADAY